MKNKTLFISLLTLLLSIGMIAQKGTSAVNIQLGVGGGDGGAKLQAPAIFGSYEHFVGDRISVGVIAGYTTLAVEVFDWDSGEDVKDKYSNIVIGGLVNYYFVDGDKLDVYSGLKVGYGSEMASHVYYEANLGGKYYLSDNLALNTEIGYGLTIFKAGLSIDL